MMLKQAVMASAFILASASQPMAQKEVTDEERQQVEKLKKAFSIKELQEEDSATNGELSLEDTMFFRSYAKQLLEQSENGTGDGGRRLQGCAGVGCSDDGRVCAALNCCSGTCVCEGMFFDGERCRSCRVCSGDSVSFDCSDEACGRCSEVDCSGDCEGSPCPTPPPPRPSPTPPSPSPPSPSSRSGVSKHPMIHFATVTVMAVGASHLFLQ